MPPFTRGSMFGSRLPASSLGLYLKYKPALMGCQQCYFVFRRAGTPGTRRDFQRMLLRNTQNTRNTEFLNPCIPLVSVIELLELSLRLVKSAVREREKETEFRETRQKLGCSDTTKKSGYPFDRDSRSLIYLL